MRKMWGENLTFFCFQDVFWGIFFKKWLQSEKKQG